MRRTGRNTSKPQEYHVTGLVKAAARAGIPSRSIRRTSLSGPPSPSARSFLLSFYVLPRNAMAFVAGLFQAQLLSVLLKHHGPPFSFVLSAILGILPSFQ